MLDTCAPGHVFTEKLHHYWVTFSGKTYTTLPKGSHSDRGQRSGQAEIEIGHVRKIVRFLEIDKACARRVIPML